MSTAQTPGSLCTGHGRPSTGLGACPEDSSQPPRKPAESRREGRGRRGDPRTGTGKSNGQRGRGEPWEGKKGGGEREREESNLHTKGGLY